MFSTHKYKLTVFLKSGHTVVLNCDGWKFSFNNATGEYTSYSIQNADKNFGFVINQIAGYTVTPK